jgi:hypothetical protein
MVNYAGAKLLLACLGGAPRCTWQDAVTCGGEIDRRTQRQPTESAPNTLLSQELIAATSKTETAYVEAMLSIAT